LDSGARTALIVSIVGFFICAPFFCPAGIYEGVKAQGRIRDSNGALHGYGLATAGIAIGSAGTVLWVLWLLIVLASSA
jgi:hypothetical protein